MKKLLCIAITVFMFFGITAMAVAGDKLIQLPIEKVFLSQDKDGKPYARLICGEERVLNGIKYKTTVAVTAFGDQYEPASQLKEGGTLKAIVSSKEFNGRLNYTVITFTP